MPPQAPPCPPAAPEEDMRLLGGQTQQAGVGLSASSDPHSRGAGGVGPTWATHGCSSGLWISFQLAW